jgi:hypothetical protein
MFIPDVLRPEPEPWFVRELHIIDRSLRVVFGYERYLRKCWVIERRLNAERYAISYASLFRDNLPRFIEQPVFDTNQPLYDDEGGISGYRQVGSRTFDLAPEWEWIANIETPQGGYKPLSHDDLIALRRQYAWNYNHPYSRARFEEEERRKAEAKEAAKKTARVDTWMDSIEEAWSVHGKRVTI